MGGISWPRLSQTLNATGCAPFRQLIRCNACGNKTICHAIWEASGLLMRTGCRQQSSSFLRMSLHASAATKRSTYWVGYKAHFSETSDEDLPRLITQVTTTIAPIPDRQALPEIHEVLDQRQFLPEQQRAQCWVRWCGSAGCQEDRSIRWIWWVRPPKTTGGKRENRAVSAGADQQ